MTIRTLQLGMGWFPEQTGGLNRFYHNLLPRLPEVGVESRGLVTGSRRVAEMSGGQVQAFARTDSSLPWRWYKARQAGREILKNDQIDLVCSHFALYAFPLASFLRDRPFMVHFHGPWAHESSVELQKSWLVERKKALENTVYSRAQRFFVHSEAFRDVLHEQFAVPFDKISIGPGGVDSDAYDTGVSRDAARRRLGWPTDRPIVFAVRRLVRRMGLENLISAFVEVKKHVPDALLMIAGKGPIAEELKQQIIDLQLQNHARLVGFVSDEDLPFAYRSANISVVPTLALEGFGLITVESLAAGTPALVTPVGALPEVVRGLSPELILPDTQISTLADAIVSSLRGTIDLPDDRACMVYAREHYDWSVVIRAVRAVYDEVLEGP